MCGLTLGAHFSNLISNWKFPQTYRKWNIISKWTIPPSAHDAYSTSKVITPDELTFLSIDDIKDKCLLTKVDIIRKEWEIFTFTITETSSSSITRTENGRLCVISTTEDIELLQWVCDFLTFNLISS